MTDGRAERRILVSHTGNLPRPADLEALGNDAPAFTQRLPSAVSEVVQHQLDIGMDIVNDGEYVKRSGFGGYIRERLSGLEARPGATRAQNTASSQWGPNRTGARDQNEFPGFHATHQNNSSVTGSFVRTPDGGGWAASAPGSLQVCTGAVTFIGHDAIRSDVETLLGAVAGKNVPGFLASLGPGTLAASAVDEHYGNEEAFLFGMADAMHAEYQAIVDGGLLLQIDEPELARAYQFYPAMSLADYRDYTRLRVAAINRALQGIPAERVRLHFCWGSGHRPHKNDVALGDIMDVILEANVGCFAFEASNGRHDWEWEVFRELKLPPGKTIMPGVIGHASDIIEHPRLIAQRLVRYAELVGRENVIAGTDCGLGTRVGHAEIAWAKLTSAAEGARIASQELWGRPA
ncbi:MAG TPA: cobalamin-independent methionine synthase II family protein [Chloroflexota bacterium]|jgi:5-methyltetrahydropteroyltriglutamate--homocysteine methyltransferase|nr:cobalamin-independent methionine synthase II family protein [Chloroflexota bacterium]